MEILKTLGQHLDTVYKEIHETKKNIQTAGRRVAEEIMTIPGWKSMVEECLWHYEKFPKEFLGWCSYEVWDGKLLVKKHYTGDDESYTFLEIDLTKSLEDQVKEAVAREKEDEELSKEIKRQEKYKQQMETLHELGMEEIPYEEWVRKTEEK